jgi:hypothetical protein
MIYRITFAYTATVNLLIQTLLWVGYLWRISYLKLDAMLFLSISGILVSCLNLFLIRLFIENEPNKWALSILSLVFLQIFCILNAVHFLRIILIQLL